MAHMLITTHGTRGDVVPFIVLGQALKRLGHDVTFFTHYENEAEVVGAGLQFVSWETKEEWDEYVRFIQQVRGPMLQIEQYEKFFEESFAVGKCRNELAKLKPYCLFDDVVLITRFSSSISSLLAAEIYQKPIVPFFLSPSYITQIRIDYDLFEESNTRALNIVRETLGLPPVKSYCEWTCIMKYKICLWPKWFYHHQHIQQNYFIAVGFLDYSVYKSASHGFTKEVTEFLARGEAPIIISGSSGKDDTLKYFDIAISACVQLGLRVLVVTPFQELIPAQLIDNDSVKWVDFIDFEALLPYAKAIIHHGGIGTITYALRYKVPQLILAGNIDRPFNASIIKKLGLGEFLPVAWWSVNNIKAAVKEVLDNKIRLNCNHYGNMMLKENAISRTTKILESAAGNPQFLIDITKVLSTAYECAPYNFNPETNASKGQEPTESGKKDHSKLQNIVDKRKDILTKLLHEKLSGKNFNNKVENKNV